ncbi:hypothetical protein OH809_35390 [Streptomyces sp. NBC_00873]|nr:hypothetical protein OH809_35390 [Streptomyces sp. NBC_00873]WTA42610.1 hypothetical protein OH821_08320 [Streptomyces sp. NBC_00842]
MVADRALAAAERSGDAVAIGAASRRVAKSLALDAVGAVVSPTS